MVNINACDNFQKDNLKLIDFNRWIIVLINKYPIIFILIK